MFREDLDALAAAGLLRKLRVVASQQGPRIILDGREVLLLASNNYLGLASHPRIRAAAIAAIEQYGVGAGASRLISGTMSPHQELESRLAQWKQTPAALLFSSGYLANLSVPAAILGPGDLILADAANHASLWDGCRLSGATFRVYRHRDMGHLEGLLRRRRPGRRVLLVTDGVFSMDGDLAPLPDLVNLAGRYDAMLFLDDAHGMGVLGKTGRGTAEHCGVADRITIQMGTLGKALGVYGAYVAGSVDLATCLLNRARGFLYTTALPPAVAAAASEALKVLEQEPWRREQLWANTAYFHQGLRRLGFAVPEAETPILPIPIGEPDLAVLVSERLLEEGVFAPAIRPPTVPEGTSRLRLTVTATHTREDLDLALAALERVGRSLGLI